MRGVGRLGSRRDVVPALTTLVRDATTGRRPAAVLLTAPSGAGKTRVLDDLVGALDRPVRRVAGDGSSVHRPFDTVARLLGVTLPAPVPVDAQERLLARLDELAAQGPQVLVVDDVHRVDAASLGVLEAIVDAAADLRTAVVMTREPAPARAFLTRMVERGACVELDLPRLDAMDLDVLVHEHTGSWPGPRLRSLLSGRQPLEAQILLDDLVPELVRDRDLLELPAETRDAAGPVGGAIAHRVSRLDGRNREAARVLAVLGRPATLSELAAVLATPAVTLVEPVQALADEDVVVLDRTGTVRFRHDAWRQEVYADIPEPLRAVLHGAAATQAEPAEQPRHLVSAGASADDLMAVGDRAAAGLDHAPAVEADVWAELVEGVAPDSERASELAARRARALALSGQFRRAEEVALAALPQARDLEVYAELRRVVIFSLSTRGEVAGALAFVDETLGLPLPDRSRRILTDHRAYLAILGGAGPVPEEPLAADPLELTTTGLVAETVRRYLLGEHGIALEYAWEATRRTAEPGLNPQEGASAEVWPPVVELAQRGPQAASAALQEVVRLRDRRGSAWQDAAHQMQAGMLDLVSGRLADAAATLDSALEVAATTGWGWISQAVGTRASLDVLRGDLPAAEARLDEWEAGAHPLQLGLPATARARVALLEAQRRYAAAAELARDIWQHAVSSHQRTWLVNAGPDFARVAIRAADDGLLTQIRDALVDGVPRPAAPGAAASLQLADALVGPAEDLAEAALVAAETAAGVGDVYTALLAREEAAVATAVLGDRSVARERGSDAVALAASCGADGVVARISGRLRAAGVRLGSAATRSRPTTGWESLTPTEELVVECVAQGQTGPEIAQRLNISPRTVQTHVSHALTKLGLSNRVELAAAAAVRTKG